MILLLTHSGDFFTIDLVEESLRVRGAEFVRVDTDRLPVEQPLTLDFSSSGRESVCLLVDGKENCFCPQDVTAVWARRLYPARYAPKIPNEVVTLCSPAAAQQVLDGFDLFHEARWINPRMSGIKAESKIAQLSVARRLGLQVPETLITNDKAKVRTFFYQHQGRLITKLLVPQVYSMEASEEFAYTTRVQAQHLDQLDNLYLMPQIFQPFISKKREHRVVVVGDQIFAGSLLIPESGPLAVDWRQAQPGQDLCWQESSLPAELKEKLLRLVRAFGLEFGVLDLIETDSGSFFFLEVNQAGEWGMLQKELNLPIAQAIAERLCS